MDPQRPTSSNKITPLNPHPQTVLPTEDQVFEYETMEAILTQTTTWPSHKRSLEASSIQDRDDVQDYKALLCHLMGT